MVFWMPKRKKRKKRKKIHASPISSPLPTTSCTVYSPTRPIQSSLCAKTCRIHLDAPSTVRERYRMELSIRMVSRAIPMRSSTFVRCFDLSYDSERCSFPRPCLGHNEWFEPATIVCPRLVDTFVSGSPPRL